MYDEEEFDKLNDQPGMNKGDSSFILHLPFSAELERVTKGDLSQAETDFRKDKIVCFLRTPYFCVPLNPKFRQMCSLVYERLFNIRNSRDIQGRVISYALREPPIDPGAFMSLAKQNVNASDALAMVMGDLDSPLPYQRFDVLLSQAIQLCNELPALGERFVSAVEKKEGETFAIIRA
ncbi:hypothetical protein H9Q70_000694 [Fusarium xylarioides]|nr:hypothetical protein H9Q70_000694 [Fusarium xylarioides]